MKTISSDLTIIGAGLSGICAALTAARCGLTVSLVHNRPVPGGNASSEVCISINGAAANGDGASVYARETGAIEDVKMKIMSFNQKPLHNQSVKDWPMIDAAYLDLLYNEPNISLFLNTCVYDVIMQGNKIIGVKALQDFSEQEFIFESPLFTDCSGDGVIAYKSGAKFMWGEEGKDEYGESLAPPEKTSYVMGNSLLFFSRDAGVPVSYTRPDFAYDITNQPFWENIKPELDRPIGRNGKLFNGYWWIEIGGLEDTIGSNENITYELRKIVYGMWDYIKNSGVFEDVDTLVLDKVATVAGKRESRRFIGDYVLSQQDIDQKADFYDAVGTGGWTMDIHAQKGIYDSGHATFWHFVPGMYNFPYRCLYARDVENLFIGGRIMSATHVAMSSTRVMSTCAVSGQAIGAAAVLCKKHKVNPRGITEQYTNELKELLIDMDQTIVGMNNEKGIEIFKNAKITTTSTRKYENTDYEDLLTLDENICLALVCTERLDTVEVGIKNSDKDAVMEIEVYTGKRPENYIPEQFVKTLTIELDAGFDGYISIPVSAAHGGDHKIYLIFKQNSSLSLYYGNQRLTGAVSFKAKPNSIPEKYPKMGKYRLNRIRDTHICFRNILPFTDIYSPENMLNGWNRPYGLPNLWVSAGDGMPQTISIEFEKPVDIDNFTIFFDTCLEEDNFLKIPSYFVKAYCIKAWHQEGELKQEQKNCCNRRFVHYFNVKKVTKIEVRLEESYGAPDFGVFGFQANSMSQY